MFLTEKELVKTLKRSYEPICDWDISKHPTKVLEEVNIGYGIADLVISKFKESIVKTSSLTKLDIVVYKIIQDGDSITFDKIQEITRNNKRSIQSSIQKLVQESYIQEEDTLLKVTENYTSIATKTIAIEAKLKNWRRALEQAHRYKWFANESYVVLDSVNAHSAIKNINEFKKYNIGLGELHKKLGLQIHYKPVESDPINEQMQMLYDQYLRTSLLSRKVRLPRT